MSYGIFEGKFMKQGNFRTIFLKLKFWGEGIFRLKINGIWDP